MIDAFIEKVESKLLERSGAVFYSGRSAFSEPSDIYILGLNPGGSPLKQATDTIRHNIEQTLARSYDYSEYQDGVWLNKSPGTHGMQRRVRHLLAGLGRDPRKVPASNVVFIRSERERYLAENKRELLNSCWPFHEDVIQGLGIRVVLCFGGTAGAWVREALGAREKIGAFTETNNRRWTSEAHQTSDGRAVITLTHPSIAKWDSPMSDPTGLVASVLKDIP